MAKRLGGAGFDAHRGIAMRLLSLDFGGGGVAHLSTPSGAHLRAGAWRAAAPSSDEPYEPRNSPVSVPRVCTTSERTSIWHVRADSDIPSGKREIPTPEIAVPLGVVPGTRISLDNPQRNVPVSWLETSNTGPSYRLDQGFGGGGGSATGRCDAAPVRPARPLPRCEVPIDSTTGFPAAALAMMTGLPEATCQTRTDLADAIRSDPSRHR